MIVASNKRVPPIPILNIGKLTLFHPSGNDPLIWLESNLNFDKFIRADHEIGNVPYLNN